MSLADFQRFEGDSLIVEEFIPFLEQTNPNSLADEPTLKKAFQVTKNAVLKLYEDYNVMVDVVRDDNEKFLRRGQLIINLSLNGFYSISFFFNSRTRL